MKKRIVSFMMIAAAVIMSSCNDDENNSGNYPLAVRMTDAPADYDEVNIDIQAVEVTGSNGQTVLLNTEAGIYNLLDLSNGISTMIATNTLADARVNQIRLILGNDNTVVVDGVTYPLSTPSAQQSGLKLQLNEELQADTQNVILLDFDANQSIVVTGNGSYSLKPVIRNVDLATTGNISGSISLIGVLATVTATSSTGVEYSSTVNENGQFQVSGLAPGTYTLTITPYNSLLPTIQTDVQVQAGSTTNVGLVTVQ